jgi:hypothetical protein
MLCGHAGRPRDIKKTMKASKHKMQWYYKEMKGKKHIAHVTWYMEHRMGKKYIRIVDCICRSV